MTALVFPAPPGYASNGNGLARPRGFAGLAIMAGICVPMMRLLSLSPRRAALAPAATLHPAGAHARRTEAGATTR